MTYFLLLLEIQRQHSLPSAPTPACIQIWEFRSSQASGQEDSLDSDQPLKLVQMVRTDWGHPRHLRWCPSPLNAEDKGSTTQLLIGLLAGTWSEGYVRVLDIQLDKDQASQTSYCIQPLKSLQRYLLTP